MWQIDPLMQTFSLRLGDRCKTMQNAEFQVLVVCYEMGVLGRPAKLLFQGAWTLTLKAQSSLDAAG